METTDNIVHNFLIAHDFSKDRRQEEAYHGRIYEHSVSLFRVMDLWAVTVNNVQVGHRHLNPINAIFAAGESITRRKIREALGL